MTTNNLGNPNIPDNGNTKGDVAAMSHIINPDWYRPMLAEAMAVSRFMPAATHMTAEAMKKAALKLIEAAGLDDFDLAVLGLMPGWKVQGMNGADYSKVVGACVFGGVGIPADFKAALLAKKVILAGAVMDHRYPLVFDKHVRKYATPTAAAVVGTEYVIFGAYTDKKAREQWMEMFQGEMFSNVKFIHSPAELMAEFYGDLEVTLPMLSAYIRLHAPETNANDKSLLKIGRGREAAAIRVVEDKDYVGYHKFHLDGMELKKYTALEGVPDGLYPYNAATNVLHDGKSAIKTFALVLHHVLTGYGEDGMKGRKAFLTDAWLEQVAGSHNSDRIDAIRTGKLAALEFVPTAGYGFHLVNGSPDSMLKAQRAILRKGIPCIAHKQMSWVACGIGAEAKGVGLQEIDGVQMLLAFFKQDKAEKFLDRLQLVKPTAMVPNMARSALSICLSNGKTVALEGVKLNLAFANCPLMTNGSGNACARPDFKQTVMHKSKIRTEIVLAKDTTKDEAEMVGANLVVFHESGKTDDPIISYDGGARVTFNDFNAEFKREKSGRYYWDEDKRLLVVECEIEWQYETSTEKFVFDGAKFRTTPDEYWALSSDGNPVAGVDVFLTHEEVKGPQALVAMWAEDTDGVVYEPNMGLSAEQQASFAAWVKAHTKITTVRRKVNHILKSNLRKRYDNDPAYKFLEDNVIEWTGPVVYGSAVAAVEYSTTYQAVGEGEMFPELLYSLTLLSREFSYLWEEKDARKRRGALHGINHMVENQHGGNSHKTPPTIDIKAGDLILTEDEIDGKTHGKQFLKALEEKYPIGFYAKYGDKLLQYVDANALRHLTGAAGTLHPVVANVVDLVKFCFDGGKKKRAGKTADGLAKSYFKCLKKAAAVMMISPNLIKRPFRTGKLLNRKVSTVSRYGVDAWELHVNPLDPVVTDGTLSDGQIVGANRVPVFFWGAFVVVLDPRTPVGVFEVDPYCWAAIHEGDSDGDGIAVLVLPETAEVGKRGEQGYRSIFPQKLLWKACHESGTRLSASGLWYDPATDDVSPLTGGYSAMYGNDPMNHPFFGFLAAERKKNVDVLVSDGNGGIFNAMRLPVEEGSSREASYLTLCNAVRTHYSQYVGASYGVSAIALYLLNVAFGQGRMDRVKDLIPLVVFTSRFLHEGRHLCGTNAKAQGFWAAYDQVVRVNWIEVVDDEGNVRKLEGVAAMRYVVEDVLGANEIADDGLHLSDAQLLLLRVIRKIALVGNAADRANDDAKFNHQEFYGWELQDWARVFRLCRLVGKGAITRLERNEQLKDSAAIVSGVDGEGHSLSDRLEAAHIEDVALNTMLGKVAKSALSLHSTIVRSLRKQVKDAEKAQYGFGN